MKLFEYGNATWELVYDTYFIERSLLYIHLQLFNWAKGTYPFSKKKPTKPNQQVTNRINTKAM